MDDAYICGCNLPGRVEPAGRACAGRNDDPAALELAHIFSVYLKFVHARAGHVFLSREDFIQAQLRYGLSSHLVVDLKLGTGSVEVFILIEQDVL